MQPGGMQPLPHRRAALHPKALLGSRLTPQPRRFTYKYFIQEPNPTQEHIKAVEQDGTSHRPCPVFPRARPASCHSTPARPRGIAEDRKQLRHGTKQGGAGCCEVWRVPGSSELLGTSRHHNRSSLGACIWAKAAAFPYSAFYHRYYFHFLLV